jgi:four helix bundle protein
MADYRHLKAWQRAYGLILEVYDATSGYPADERFGLTSQSRRAAVSIAANVAEGAGRGGGGEFTRFLWIARGSLTELITLLAIARDLRYLEPERSENLIAITEEVGRMIMGLLKSRGAVPRRDGPK